MPASAIARSTTSGPTDVDAERGQHVGGAALRGERAVAVLGDRHAAGGHDQRGAGGDVERAGAVAAGADDVDRALRGADAMHFARITRTAAAYLVHGLAAHAQRHQQAADLRRGRVARHEHGERRLGLSSASAGPRRRGRSAAFAGRSCRLSGEFEEVAEQRMAVLGGDAFGVELHAEDRQLAVLQALIEPSSLSAVTRARRAGVPGRPSASDSAWPGTARAGRAKTPLPSCGSC